MGVVPPSDVEVAAWRRSRPALRRSQPPDRSRPTRRQVTSSTSARGASPPSTFTASRAAPRCSRRPSSPSQPRRTSRSGSLETRILASSCRRSKRSFATLHRRARSVEVKLLSSAPPGLVPADARAVVLGLDAFEEVLGVRPLLIRSGGAIPLVSALAARGVATVLTGFSLNESNVHSPNERIPTAYLPLGIETAAALYRHLSDLG